MITINIPGRGTLELTDLVLDLNGTIALVLLRAQRLIATLRR